MDFAHISVVRSAGACPSQFLVAREGGGGQASALCSRASLVGAVSNRAYGKHTFCLSVVRGPVPRNFWPRRSVAGDRPPPYVSRARVVGAV